MMGKFHNIKNDFTKYSTLRFFRNFISNHFGSIEDKNAFLCMNELKSYVEFIRILKSAFSERKIKALQEGPSIRKYLSFDDEPYEMLRQIWFDAPARKTLRKVIVGIIDEKLNVVDINQCKETFPQRLDVLKKMLQLSDFERDILLVLILISDETLTFTDEHSRRTTQARVRVTFVAKCLDCGCEEVLNALNPSRKLRRYNCVDSDIDFNSDLHNFLNGSVTEPLANMYFQKYKGEVLPWDFYGDLSQKHGTTIKEMMHAGSGNSPVNILLYGAPGTGKTSFAKTLAKELQMECYCIVQSINDKRGQSCSTPDFRFSALQICNDQIDQAHSMIIVDEADDMLRGNCSRGGLFSFFGDGRPTGDKGMLNSILDSVKTPTVWISNTSADELDESSRRRFDYSIKFEKLTNTQRHVIWRNNVGKMKLDKLFDDSMLEVFAAKYAVSAGGIALCLGTISKLKPAKADISALVDKLMAPHCELLNIPVVNDKILPAKDYSLEGLNIQGDIPLPRLVEAVRNFQTDDSDNAMDRPRMNLLLSGAPGTGKTEFVKYLGMVLKNKVVIKMGSDLLSKWVGETEKNIKNTFAEAKAEKAILFLDEIDGLVQSREKSQHSWEVTQVNELLYQMENFQGVMIGATNFSANLDVAILRRFTFKLEFDYLDNAGKKLFFERMFQVVLNDDELSRLEEIINLTPGDFRTVRQGLYYLGGRKSNADYLSALERESHIKGQNKFAKKTRLGF